MNPLIQAILSPVVTVLLTALAPVLSGLWITYKLRSSRLFLVKRWLAAGGLPEFFDAKIKAFDEEIRERERFYIVHGIKAQSRRQLHAVIDWLAHYKVDVTEAKRAGTWFKLNPAVRLKVPRRRLCIGMTVCFSTLIILQVLALSGAFSQKTILWFKATHTAFSTDGKNYAKSVLSDRWRIDTSQCRQSPKTALQETPLLPKEYAELCGALENGELAKLVSPVLVQTRIFFVICIISFLLPTWTAYTSIKEMQAAHQLRNRLKIGRQWKSQDRRARKKRMASRPS